MKIIFDFDHTLYSTQRFYDALKKSFYNLGVDENLFQKTFNQSKKTGKGYEAVEQVELICKEKPSVCKNDLKDVFEEILGEDFIYPDVVSVLKDLKSYDLYILSYSKIDLQGEKISCSKIRKFFKEAYITDDDTKVSAMERIISKDEKAVIVDDNLEVLSKLKNKFSNLVTVRMNRGEGKYKDWPDNSEVDYSIRKLEELKNILTEI